MAATVPGAELAVIPTAGHSPQFENPAAWFAALHDFLADLPSLPGRPALPRTGVVHPG
jgi:hypothetical protein